MDVAAESSCSSSIDRCSSFSATLSSPMGTMDEDDDDPAAEQKLSLQLSSSTLTSAAGRNCDISTASPTCSEVTAKVTNRKGIKCTTSRQNQHSHNPNGSSSCFRRNNCHEDPFDHMVSQLWWKPPPNVHGLYGPSVEHLLQETRQSMVPQLCETFLRPGHHACHDFMYQFSDEKEGDYNDGDCSSIVIPNATASPGRPLSPPLFCRTHSSPMPPINSATFILPPPLPQPAEMVRPVFSLLPNHPSLVSPTKSYSLQQNPPQRLESAYPLPKSLQRASPHPLQQQKLQQQQRRFSSSASHHVLNNNNNDNTSTNGSTGTSLSNHGQSTNTSPATTVSPMRSRSNSSNRCSGIPKLHSVCKRPRTAQSSTVAENTLSKSPTN